MARRRLTIVMVLGLSLSACEGSFDMNSTQMNLPDQSQPEPDASADFSTPDLAPNTDMGTFEDADEDLAEPSPCETVQCGDNATCSEGTCACNAGFTGDPNAGCTLADPCAEIQCQYGATCNAGDCICDAGFEEDGDNCVQITPGDTAARTRDEVCQKWQTDHPTTSTTMWQVEPADACDPGVIHPTVLTDALRRTSLFRWLVGLPGVTSAPGAAESTQACATTLAASNRGLSHSLDETYTCYTQAAAQGAGSSNLAIGVNHPASSVDLYIGDVGVRSLGHRRWIFNPRMGATNFGQRNNYSCMYAFDSSSNANPEYVAYPAPGFFPRSALIGYWSFGSTQLNLSNATVTMTRTDTNAEVPVNDVNVPSGNYGIQVVAWQVPGAELDVEYEITIGLSSGETRVYRTTLVNCN